LASRACALRVLDPARRQESDTLIFASQAVQDEVATTQMIFGDRESMVISVLILGDAPHVSAAHETSSSKESGARLRQRLWRDPLPSSLY